MLQGLGTLELIPPADEAGGGLTRRPVVQRCAEFEISIRQGEVALAHVA